MSKRKKQALEVVPQETIQIQKADFPANETWSSEDAPKKEWHRKLAKVGAEGSFELLPIGIAKSTSGGVSYDLNAI